MQKQLNAREKNLPEMGNVLQSFQRMYNLIPVNDGIRKSKALVKSSYPTMFLDGASADLQITDREFDITLINDSFIQVEGTATYRVELGSGMGSFSSSTEETEASGEYCSYIFIGFKSASQVIREFTLKINERPDLCGNYMNQNNLQETFLYNVCSSEAKRKNKSGIYTLWEDAWKKSNSVCGTYIPMTEVRKNNGNGSFRFKYSIPIDTLLAFQALDMFPSSIMGVLKLTLSFQFAGAVWCPVSQAAVYDELLLSEDDPGDANRDELVSFDARSSHEFLQVGTEYGVVNLLNASNLQSPKQMKVSVSNFTVTNLKSHIKGFSVKEPVKEAIYNMLRETPMLIPAQKLDKQTFGTGAITPGAFDATISLSLRNVNCISVMFRTDPGNNTIYRNPMVKNLQLTVDNTVYPPERISTMNVLSPEYLTYQLQASELDGAITPSASFVNSIIRDRLKYTLDSAGNVTVTGRKTKTSSDGTDFVFTVETERGQSGYVFDGLTSNEAVNINLKFESVSSDPQYNVYYNYDTINYNGRHPVAPELHIARDVFWKLGINEKGEPYMIMDDKTLDPK